MRIIFAIMCVVLSATYTFAQQHTEDEHGNEIIGARKQYSEMMVKSVENPSRHRGTYGNDPWSLARALKRQGWKVPKGEKSIEKQITEIIRLNVETRSDGSADLTKRYVISTDQCAGSSFISAQKAARFLAEKSVATILLPELKRLVEKKRVGEQTGTSLGGERDLSVETNAIVAASLEDAPTVMTLYSEWQGKTEVRVYVAFDSKDISARIKRDMMTKLGVDTGDLVESLFEGMSFNWWY